MQHFCPKCQKVTEFVEAESVVRTGDHGFAKQKVARCAICNFVPLFTYVEEKNGDKGNTKS